MGNYERKYEKKLNIAQAKKEWRKNEQKQTFNETFENSLSLIRWTQKQMWKSTRLKIMFETSLIFYLNKYSIDIWFSSLKVDWKNSN